MCHLCLSETAEAALYYVASTRGENPERYLCEDCLRDALIAATEVGMIGPGPLI